ncbi:hypothetical protein M409DRAFT_51544 [Zasmidium cellare ATCC 36951]|uniref:Oxidoreductase molybdopterin-binding domain-containing protein n=1 Tax=Zasmidium cellare ATCC 36951 TaxID=1080233 RepID=A0A6A6CUX1_ZASCE|nr:uncharacterized protein M409DRAFT_51544 [Zasmidium cellare ATCC 36951]KAF2170513.1 hypothetical protein M409DRAFT_51544 [Zasmidium cellare ATCC 36951]
MPDLQKLLDKKQHKHQLQATMEKTSPDNNPKHPSLIKTTPGFHFRPPPPPHNLTTFITPDTSLFQTIHMGAAIIDHNLWRLEIHGLVSHPYTLSLTELKALPSTKITAFHECYGSPLKPPTEFVRRVGNVTWTGVQLAKLLAMAEPLPEADFIWSDGLDSGTFASVEADRYQKDLPLSKAFQDEVLVAYEINGQPLDVRRGGPVRLVVPGWFGTNSVKWLCSLAARKGRSPGPFTTTFYNELVPGDESGKMRPVWEVEPSSMIVSPEPDVVVRGPEVRVWGWAWSGDGVERVEVDVDEAGGWVPASVIPRKEFEWQRFEVTLRLPEGQHTISARASSCQGHQQPLRGRRNQVHRLAFQVF